MCDQIIHAAWPYAIGFAVALVAGQAVTCITLNTLWAKLGIRPGKRHGQSQSAILGTVESLMYVTALLTGNAQFIGLWLGLKTVIKWRHWESDVAIPREDGKGEPRWILGRMAYNLFLLGNSLVLIFAAAGWKAIESLSSGKWPAFWAIIVGLVLGSIALVIWARLSTMYRPLHKSDPRLRRVAENL